MFFWFASIGVHMQLTILLGLLLYLLLLAAISLPSVVYWMGAGVSQKGLMWTVLQSPPLLLGWVGITGLLFFLSLLVFAIGSMVLDKLP